MHRLSVEPERRWLRLTRPGTRYLGFQSILHLYRTLAETQCPVNIQLLPALPPVKAAARGNRELRCCPAPVAYVPLYSRGWRRSIDRLAVAAPLPGFSRALTCPRHYCPPDRISCCCPRWGSAVQQGLGSVRERKLLGSDGYFFRQLSKVASGLLTTPSAQP